MVPWQIRVFLHTLDFSCKNSAKKIAPEKEHYTLARDGKRPLLIEMEIWIPANANCKIEMEYEAAFLKLAQFKRTVRGTIL
jgi:hypothetical protein